MNAGLIAVLILISLFGGLVSFSSTAKADMPIQDTTLYFSSLSDLNAFYENKKFSVLKYGGAGWDTEVHIDKSKIYDPKNGLYILAPYDYYDGNGYPHQISKSGCIISLNNIDRNATIIITGFNKATITVRDFHGTLVLGKYVSVQKKVEHHEEWWSSLINILSPGFALVKIGMDISTVMNTHPAVYVGITDSTITVEDTKRVILQNIFVVSEFQDPVIIRNSDEVVMNGVFLVPPQHTTVEGSGIILKDIDNLTIHGINEICRYHYNLDLRNIGNINVNGYLTLNGSYLTDKDKKERYGIGIYADRVGGIEAKNKIVNAVIGNGYSADVYAIATGSYNETNQTFWGNIHTFGVFVYSTGENDYLDTVFFKVEDKIFISERVNLSDLPNATVDMSGVGEREYHVADPANKTYLNATLTYSDLDVLSNDTGKVKIVSGSNNTTYILHRFMNLTLGGSLLDGSKIDASLPMGLNFTHLKIGLGVADNGSNEQSLIEYMNGTSATVIDVEKIVAYNVGYISGTGTMNVPLIFGGFAAVVSLFVTIGWMRIGFMMHSINQQKKEQAKDMAFKAFVGTIVTVTVLFGWANLVGLMNWVFGG